MRFKHLQKTAAILMLASFIFSAVMPAGTAWADWEDIGENWEIKKGTAIEIVAATDNHRHNTLGTAGCWSGAVVYGLSGNYGGQYSVAMGDHFYVHGAGAIGIGAYSNATADYSTALGYFAAATVGYSTSVGYEVKATGLYSTALGDYACATKSSTVAIGSYTVAAKDYAVSLGNYATSSGLGSQALGNYATALGNYATALGNYANASVIRATALGDHACATGDSSTAVGEYAHAVNAYATALGGDSCATGENSTAVGRYTWAEGIGALASGYSACASSGYATASGTLSCASLYATAVGAYSVALDYGTAVGTSSCAANSAVALGRNANASAEYAMALGFYSSATAKNATAIGHDASATHGNSVALGAYSVSKAGESVSSAKIANKTYTFNSAKGSFTFNTVSVGSAGNERQIVNVANGAIANGSTDAVNGGQIFDIISQLPSSNAVTEIDLNSGKNGIAYTLADGTGGNVSLLDLKTTQSDANATAIGKISNSDAMKSGITSAKVTAYDSHVANTAVHITAAERTKWDNAATAAGIAQNAVNSAVKSVAVNGTTGLQIKTVGGTTTNLSLADLQTTQSKANATAITEIKTYVTASGLNGNGQVISNVKAQGIAANGTYAATTGQVYNATLSSVSLGTDKKTLTIKENSTSKSVDLSALETTQSKANATAIGSRSYTKQYNVTSNETIANSINKLDTAIGSRNYAHNTGDGGFLTNNQSAAESLNALNNAAIKSLALGSNGKITATRVDDTTLVTGAIHDYKITGASYNDTTKKLTITEKDAYNEANVSTTDVVIDTSRVVAADNSSTVTISGGATAKIAGGTTNSDNAADTKNITTTVSGANGSATVEVTLNKAITLDSVTTGATGNNSVLNNAGLAVKASGKTTTITGSAVNTTNVNAATITAGTGATTKVTLSENAVKIGSATYITNTGLNANSLAISNVKADTSSDTNAVNYGQIKNNVADIILESGVLKKKTTASDTPTVVGTLRDERVTGISYDSANNKFDVTVAEYYSATSSTFDVDLSDLRAKVAAETTSGEKYVGKFAAGRNTQITETGGVATIGTKDDVGFNSVLVYNKTNPGTDGYMTMDKTGISYADTLDEDFKPKEGTKFVGLNSQGFGIGEYIKVGDEIKIDESTRTFLSHGGLVIHNNTFIDVSNPSAAAYINANDKQIAHVASGGAVIIDGSNAANMGDIYAETRTGFGSGLAYVADIYSAGKNFDNLDRGLQTVRDNTITGIGFTGNLLKATTASGGFDIAVLHDYELTKGRYSTTASSTGGPALVFTQTSNVTGDEKNVIVDVSGLTGGSFIVNGSLESGRNMSFRTRTEGSNVIGILETVPNPTFTNVMVKAETAPEADSKYTVQSQNSIKIGHYVEDPANPGTYIQSDDSMLDGSKLVAGGKTFIDTTNADAYINANDAKIIGLATTGAIDEDSTYAVSGGEIYNLINVDSSANYIVSGTNVAANLKSLDTQLKTVSDKTITGFAIAGDRLLQAETAIGTKLNVTELKDTVTGVSFNAETNALDVTISDSYDTTGTTDTYSVALSDLKANIGVETTGGGTASVSSLTAGRNIQMTTDTTGNAVIGTKDDVGFNSVLVYNKANPGADGYMSMDKTGISYADTLDEDFNPKEGTKFVGLNSQGFGIGEYIKNEAGEIVVDTATRTSLSHKGLTVHGSTFIDVSNPSAAAYINAQGKQIAGVASGISEEAEFNAGNTNAANVGDIYTATTMQTAGSYYDADSAVTTAVANINNALGTITSGNFVRAYNTTDTESTISANINAIDSAIGDIKSLNAGGSLITYDKTTGAGTVAENLNSLDAAVTGIKETIGDYAGTITGTTYAATGTIAGDIKAIDTQVAANAAAAAQNVQDIAAVNENITVEAGSYKHISAGANVAGNLKALDAAIANTQGNEIVSFATSETGRVTAKKTDGTTLNVAQLQDYKLSEATLNGKTLVITSKDSYGTGIVEKTVDLSSLEAETVIQNGDTSYKGDDKNVSIQTVEDPEHEGQYITTLKLSDEITDITSITTKPDENGKVTRFDRDGVFVADGTAAITSGKITVGNSSLTSTVLTVNGKSYITEEGINANGKITGVRAGELSSTSKDAVNGSQLWNTNQRVSANEEKIAAINNNIRVGAGTYRYITSGTDVAGNLKALDAAIANSKGNEIIQFATSSTGKVTAKKADGTTLNVAQMQDYKFNEATLNGKTLVITSKDSYGTGIVERTVDLSSLEAETVIQNGNTSYKGDDKNVSIQTVEDPEHEGQYITTLKLSDEITDIKSITTKADADGKITKIDSEGIYVADGEAAITKDAVKVGDSSLTSTELTVNGKIYINEEGLNAHGKISGVNEGEISSSSKDAVNGKQLYDTNQMVASNTENITANTTKIEVLDNRIDNILINGTEYVSSKKLADDDMRASANADGSIAEAYNSAVSDGSEAGIAIGYGATVGYEDGEIGGTDTYAVNSIAIGRGATVTGANSIAIGVRHTVSGNNSGAFGDPNTVEADNSYAYGNNNMIYKTGTEINGNTHVIGNNNYVRADNTFVLGSNVGTKDAPITANNSVILGNGSTISKDVTDAVVSVGNDRKGGQRRIINLADGINATDAATVGQLNSLAGTAGQALGEIQYQLGSVSREVKEVGAMSAALAGLHYVEPSGEEGDKFVGAVAYGNYRGESAGAIGVAYKPNPNFMLSASTSIGNTYNSYNAGMSLKFGKGETAVTRAELRKQVKFVNEENRVLKTQVVNLSAENAEMAAENVEQNKAIEALKKENAEIKEMLKKLLKK